MENTTQTPEQVLDAADKNAAVETNSGDTTEPTPAADPHARTLAELTEAKEKYLRLYADFENFRRRTAREKIDFARSAGEELITALLPVLDDFERAIRFSGEAEAPGAAREGLQIVHTKLARILEQRGLKSMDAVNKPFDADLHESIAQAPVTSPDGKGKVVDEVEKGYFLHDKVIRFAKVVVGS